MGVYIRNITKEQFIEDCNAMGVLVITEGISEIDLVRCGECKYAKYRMEDAEYVKCMITQLFVSKNDFCSYGEPRESEYVAKD